MPYPSPDLYPSSTLYPGTGANPGTGGGTDIGTVSPSFNLYEQAWRTGVTVTYRVDAYLNGSAVAGATGLAPVAGQITDTR